MERILELERNLSQLLYDGCGGYYEINGKCWRGDRVLYGNHIVIYIPLKRYKEIDDKAEFKRGCKHMFTKYYYDITKVFAERGCTTFGTYDANRNELLYKKIVLLIKK